MHIIEPQHGALELQIIPFVDHAYVYNDQTHKDGATSTAITNIPTAIIVICSSYLFTGSNSEGRGLPNVVQTLADFSGEAKSKSSVSQMSSSFRLN